MRFLKTTAKSELDAQINAIGRREGSPIETLREQKRAIINSVFQNAIGSIFYRRLTSGRLSGRITKPVINTALGIYINHKFEKRIATMEAARIAGAESPRN